MYSTLLQLRAHVETEKIEKTVLKQLVQCLQRDFALLQPQLESIDQPTTSKSSTLENKIKTLEKCLSTETCGYNSRLNSLQYQLSTMRDQVCQLEQSNSNFILWKITSIQLVLEPARLWCLKLGRENATTTRHRSPIFRFHPYGYTFFYICTQMDSHLLLELGLPFCFCNCRKIWWHSALASLKDNSDQSAWSAEPSFCLEPDDRVQRNNPTNLHWILHCTDSSMPLLLPSHETFQGNWWLPL